MIGVQPTPQDYMHLTPYDHTKLTAVYTCPTWGVIRYGHNKVMPGAGRAMPLEAGHVSHQAYAAIRFFQLWFYDLLPDHARFWGEREFGADRWASMCSVIKPGNTQMTNAINFVLEALATSGYVDDPHDKRRTLANIEIACIAYLERWDWTRYPIWVADRNDPSKRVGIEVPMDILIGLQPPDGHPMDPVMEIMRYTGRIDGIHYDNDSMTSVFPMENKSASRLDEAWRMGMMMTHQLTGYCAGVQVITKLPVKRGMIVGMQLPQPKTHGDGIVPISAERLPHHYTSWGLWAFGGKVLMERYMDSPLTAPQYTHSCNRYFRPCSLIPLCYNDMEERTLSFSQMETSEWSPLDEYGTSSE